MKISPLGLDIINRHRKCCINSSTVEDAEALVSRYTTSLPQCQFDALVSIVCHVGITVNTMEAMKCADIGDVAGMQANILKETKGTVNGKLKVIKDWKVRRSEEARLAGICAPKKPLSKSRSFIANVLGTISGIIAVVPAAMSENTSTISLFLEQHGLLIFVIICSVYAAWRKSQDINR